MKDRLKDYLLKQNLSARQFADRLGVQPSSISHILNGRNKPSVDLLEKMVRTFPEMDISYMISGLKTQNSNKSAKIESNDALIRDASSTEYQNKIKSVKKMTERIVVFNTDGTFSEYFSA